METGANPPLRGERERRLRSVAKTVSWRSIAAALTFFTALFFTGSVSTSFKATLVREILALLLYYVHERSWNASKWGKFRLEKIGLPPKA